MRDIFPDLYAERRLAYATREDIAALRIPPLGSCLWNDVLHLSPVHPARIRDALTAVGHSMPNGWDRFFQIDGRLLNPAATVIYSSETIFWSGQFDIEEASVQLGRECAPYAPDRLLSLNDVPALTRQYYRSVPAGSPLALFLGVPHILHHGRIDVSQPGVQIIGV